MDWINSLNLGSSMEIVLIGALCLMLTQAIKQTKLNNHWLPWVAMALGVLIALLVGASQGDTHYWSLIILGLLIGGFSAGLFDGFKAPFQAYQTNKSTNNAPETPVQWQPSSAQLNESAKDEGSVPKDANQ
ncbi:hypothetical protein MOO45_02925 [Bombilactobacillus folatiphilus]|uniref:Holin n=1 Tax=Bombilactobacillus folatiphilus TaxID=2923362 RepID=A0ABY4PBH2_9LACO|nr:holin [Bombilactobacillus folatiphilus]UQS82617.1 hypothetical protein MOO45_02925 [Bombilactobacillus folatiphilus]